jgi:DNA-binding beta-propeller fold protein YncE
MKTFTAALVIFFLILGTVSVAAQGSGYKVVDNVKIGGDGGWDYLNCDAAAHRLYISRGTHVQVFDTQSKTVIGDIPNTIGVHGIALAQEFGRGYTSNGRDSSVTVFDLATLKTIKVIKMKASNPDTICYDPFSHRVFTFNGRSSSATAIDAQTDSIVGYLVLDGKPEFAAADGKGKVFVNLEDKSIIVAFESNSLKIIGRWPLAPGEGPSGLSMDREHNFLFSGCGNKLMVVLDAATGKVVSSLPIGAGVDATAYDPGTHFAFSSNGEGTLTVLQENSAEKFSVLDNVSTQRGSRTMALDEKTHKIYLSAATFGPAPAATPENPRPRPQMEPGSFSILILER